VPVKLLNNYFLVADIKPEILRYLRPPTDVIFRYLTETHSEAISAEFSLYHISKIAFRRAAPGDIYPIFSLVSFALFP